MSSSNEIYAAFFAILSVLFGICIIFKNIITCETKDGIINAMSINRNDMCSSKVNKMTWVYLLLLAAIFLLVIPSFVSQVIMFLKPHLANSCLKSHGFSQAVSQSHFMVIFPSSTAQIYRIQIPNKTDKIAKNAAYISFDEDISELRCWITKYLLQYLELKGYKIVYPLRDFRLTVIYQRTNKNIAARSNR
jgi:hypothetical protein